MSQGVARQRRARGGRSVRVAAVALAAALVLVGCTNEPPSDPWPIATASSGRPTGPAVTRNPTPSPTIAAPVKPPAMERSDEEGALAAAEYFIALYSYARGTGDLAEWTSSGSTTCAFCNNVAQAVESIYGSGRRLSGGDTAASELQIVDHDEQLVSWVVQLRYETDGSSLVDASGTAVESYSGDSGWLLIELAPTVRGWQILDAEQIDEPVA